uniref:Uncharacterized protein n=1 Tax=Chenopodium quinoa TaxID=63459 RepID=A0A803MSP6_CHEQI
MIGRIVSEVGTELLVTMVLLKDIKPAASNNIDTRFILLDKGKISAEGQNKTCLALVADETAAVHFQLWGQECDFFQTGDIIHLSNGIFSYQRKNLVLRAGKRGKIQKADSFKDKDENVSIMSGKLSCFRSVHHAADLLWTLSVT